MEITLKSWELIYEDLSKEGWSLGWVANINKRNEKEWIVTGTNEWSQIISKVRSLSEAFLKLYDLVRSIGN